MQNQQLNKKFGQLSNLREVTPKKAMQTEIFSSNLIQALKIKLSFNQSQNLLLSLKSARIGHENKKLASFRSNRKLTENKILTLAEYHTKRFSREKKAINFSTSSFGSRSFASTKANTERSEKLNWSGLSNFDKKSIITPNEAQDKATLQNNTPLEMSINDFDIINFCGEGAFGSVYIAKHKRTGSFFALKKILKSTVSNCMDKQSLIRQIKIHLKLNHPNIVKLYGVFSTQQAIYYVMELCYSGNIYEKLRSEGPFAQSEVKSVIRQVCSALDYLHNKDIIHRDIKAENIVIHDKVVKICDFGWASEGHYSRKSLCGTPAYLSPQVVQNKLYDKKVDVWSLGVLAFQLIFGRIPFDIKAQQDLRKIVEEELMFPQEKQVSLDCKDFIMKCLDKDSTKRWDTSLLLKHPFLRNQ